MLQGKKFILLLAWNFLVVMTAAQEAQLDVLNYDITIEPNIQERSVEGKVVIRFDLTSGTDAITLDAGDLQIEKISGSSFKSFNKKDSKLSIQLSPQEQTEHEITIHYHGTPKRGLRFNPELNQAHTVYFTDHWMPCNNQPNDKATFSLNILVPKGRQCVASGELVDNEEQGDKVLYKWTQDYETPAYTYGFVIGSFNKATQQAENVRLDYYSSDLEEKTLKKVFEETPNILKFFEEKTGIPYVQDSYSQILIGSNFQEMSGLSVFSPSYAKAVLKDSSEIHLTSHELAHQWWGNRITCKTFGHFWLNEAFAVYMATAFHEHKFGKEKYLADIALYKSIYDDLLKRGKDKPLVFRRWISSRDNRNVIYYKGAYVLHLLREELGSENFWKGIKSYSQTYFGKSVETEDFKLAMEKASNTDLTTFFKKWVY